MKNIMLVNNVIIVSLQFINWDNKTFEKTRDSEINAVYVNMVYLGHSNEVSNNINQWNQHFREFNNIIVHALAAKDIFEAKR
jgi:hypothetical protein